MASFAPAAVTAAAVFSCFLIMRQFADNQAYNDCQNRSCYNCSHTFSSCFLYASLLSEPHPYIFGRILKYFLPVIQTHKSVFEKCFL